MNLSEKILLLMNINHLKKSEVSKSTGIPYSTLDSMLKRNNFEKVGFSTIKALCQYFEVSFDYLMDDSITDKCYGFNKTFDVTKLEQTLIKKYRTLDEYGKTLIDTNLNHEYNRTLEQQAQEKEYEEENNAPIKIYFLPVSAGTGVFLDSDECEVMKVPSTPTVLKTDFAVRVNGDSMEPKYHHGDILLVQETPNVEDNEYGIFVLNGEGLFKKKLKNKLISLNAKYPPETINEYDDVKICGKVIGKL